jgi:hypothetical protein
MLGYFIWPLDKPKVMNLEELDSVFDGYTLDYSGEDRESVRDDGWVYFIQNLVTKNVKIGFTTASPEFRRRQMQTSNDCELKIIHQIKSDQPDLEEKFYHNLFAHLRIQNEWFRYEGELKEFLKTKIWGKEGTMKKMPMKTKPKDKKKEKK